MAQLAEEGFENNGSSFPTDWHIENVSGPAYEWVVGTSNAAVPAYEGTRMAYINRETVAPGQVAEDWLITPAFTLPEDAQLQFFSKLTQGGDQGSLYKIMISPSGSADTEDFDEVILWDELTLNPDHNSYLKKEVWLPGTTGSTIRLAFVMQGNNGDRWQVDKVSVQSGCHAVEGIGSGTITSGAIEFMWDNNDSSSQWEIEIVPQFTLPSGSGIMINQNPYTASAITTGGAFQPNTSYAFYIRPYCGTGYYPAAWQGPFHAKTKDIGESCSDPYTISALPFTAIGEADISTELVAGLNTGCEDGNLPFSSEVGISKVYSYTATATGSITIKLHPEHNATGVFVYGSCADIGSNCLAGASGLTPINKTIPNFPVISGSTYYIVVSSFFQGDHYDLSIVQDSCSGTIEATFTINSSCEANAGFYALAEISTLDNVTACTVTPYLNGTALSSQAVSSLGTIQFGPYGSQDEVKIVIQNQQNPNCLLVSGKLSKSLCPPENDDCGNATILTTNTSLGNTIAYGHLTNATESSEPNACPGYDDDDVWYQFVALDTEHIIQLLYINGTTLNLNHSVYEGSCGGLEHLYCSNDNYSIASNLIVGQTYTIRVYSANAGLAETSFGIFTSAFLPNCMDNNPNADIVKSLFINLLNHLINVEDSISPTIPYECPELIALAPYITDSNPKIYNFHYDSNSMQFSFSEHGGVDDVVIYPTNNDMPNVELHEFVQDINFFNYSSPEDLSYVHVTFNHDYADKRCTVKHINFCPDGPLPPCQPMSGHISLNPGLYCVEANTPFTLSLQTDATDILSYSWVFFNFDFEIIGTSSQPNPVMTIPATDTYFVELDVITTGGCVTHFSRVLSVQNSCDDFCTEINLQSEQVKELYKDLVNHLLGLYPDNPVTLPYNCPELVALAPYLDDPNPLIYTLNYSSSGILRFSFAPHTEYYDIVIPDYGEISDFGLLSFSSASVPLHVTTTYTNGLTSTGHTIRHVDFCPPGACPPLKGKIFFNQGVSCVPPNVPQGLYFATPSSLVTAYEWTFYDQDQLTVVGTSTLSHPSVSYLEEGEYVIKLLVSYGVGCTKEFYKNVSVSTQDCEQACTENNMQSVIVKELYTDLVNHLMGIYSTGNTVTNPYTCPELTALAPYITDNNPQIWNVSYSDALRFSFSNHPVHDVSVPANGLISDINIISFTNPELANNYTTVYNNFTISSLHSIRHVDFCLADCTPLFGRIQLNGAMSCVPVGVQQAFYLQANTSGIVNYSWEFYNEYGGILYVSQLSNPSVSYSAEGNYTVKLTVTDNTGCTSDFYKTVTVSTQCAEACTEINSEAEMVKDLYIILLNHLLTMNTLPADGYTCMELSALSPYITHSNPAIYNAAYSSEQVLSFSFSPGESQPDVQVGDYGTIVDINLINYNGPEFLSSPTVTYTNGTHSSLHSVKHITFCPEPEVCESHVAFVIDESGSINATEAAKIKAHLSAFVDQQLNTGTTISFIGMSDSDTDTRNDHVTSEVTTATKTLFDNWITNYKTDYSPARVNAGISPGSDYWVSGLQKAYAGYGQHPKPEIIIVLTDGSQTNNVNGLKQLLSDITNDSDSHLYIYGIGTGSYVDADMLDDEPNNPDFTPVVEVNQRLMSSLKYLLELAPTEFPASSQTELLEGLYFEYPDFDHLYNDLRYFSDKLADAAIGCGGESIPKDFCNDCQTFQPYPNQLYWISAWVREDQTYQVKTYTNGVVKLLFEDGAEQLLGEIQLLPAGEIIDGWQRIAAKFLIPGDTSVMRVELENLSPNVPVYFDDIRIHPVNGSMKSFVYDPETFRLMAELDDNNYTTFYEYDNEGGLVRVKKETARGIKTIQESRSGTSIQTEN